MTTLKQVATQVGCSTAAVSKVLNGARGNVQIGEELGKRIRAAAAELGYVANPLAQRLCRGRSDTIGFVAFGNDISRVPFWGHFLAGMNTAVAKHNKDLLLISAAGHQDVLARAQSFCNSGCIDALVVSWFHVRRQLDKLHDLRVPVVVAFAEGDIPFLNVRQDSVPACADAAAYLAELGHGRVLWAGLGASPRRKAAFLRASATHGLRVDELSLDATSPRKTTDLVKLSCDRFGDYLDGTELRATAVIAGNDLLAIGMMYAMAARGIRVPEDVSIIGYDNLYASVAVPALTTIDMNLIEMGQKATEMAIRASTPEAESIKTVFVPNRLIIQNSCETPDLTKFDLNKKGERPCHTVH